MYFSYGVIAVWLVVHLFAFLIMLALIEQKKYFKRINDLKLKSSLLIGFGISNHNNFKEAINHSQGILLTSRHL